MYIVRACTTAMHAAATHTAAATLTPSRESDFAASTSNAHANMARMTKHAFAKRKSGAAMNHETSAAIEITVADT
jgi:hypothetical protein